MKVPMMGRCTHIIGQNIFFIAHVCPVVSYCRVSACLTFSCIRWWFLEKGNTRALGARRPSLGVGRGVSELTIPQFPFLVWEQGQEGASLVVQMRIRLRVN